MPDHKSSYLLLTSLAMVLALVGCTGKTDEAEHDERISLHKGRSEESVRGAKGDHHRPLTIQEIGALIDRGDFEQADPVIRSMMLSEPDNAPILFLAARSAHDQGQLDEAIEYLSSIPPEHPDAGLPAMGQMSDWLLEAGRLAETEAALEAMLRQFGDVALVHRKMADLLNSQGRRIAASRHVHALIRMGDVTEKELLSLTTLSVPYHQTLSREIPSEAVRSEDGIPGLAGDPDPARSVDMRDVAIAKEMLVRGEVVPAANLIERLRAQFPKSTAVAALQGRIYEAIQRDEDLLRWHSSLPVGIESEPEYWSAMGSWMLRAGKPEPAIRAFCEAVTRDPTDRVAYMRLSESLAAVGETEAAERVAARKLLLDDAWQLALNVGLTRETRTADMQSLAEKLDQLGRPWEAVSWRMVLAHESGNTEQAMPDLLQQRQSLAKSFSGATENDILCGIDKVHWPLPDPSFFSTELVSGLTEQQQANNPSPQHSIELVDVAAELGIDFRYHNHREQDITHLRMSQVNGRGIAAIDYDRDGWTDLYFCDAGGRANDGTDSNPNRLYRNLAGQAMQQVSAAAAIDDRSYSLGTTTVDWNQDGFLDLFVANIGDNLLYINNGDGSFTGHIIDGSGGWTSGIVCGDLDGDALPEMVEINYIDDERALTARCWGEGMDCTPRAFQKAVDRVMKCGAQGECLAWEALEMLEPTPSFGFAGLIANFDRTAGNDLFITNDTLDNHFWVSQNTIDPDRTLLVREETLRGCAVGAAGQPQGCMGCTGGDFDRDGNLDLCVTNYWGEPSNLYLQRMPGFFTDCAAQFKITEPSLATVGFGIQAVDLDRDGWLDLTVLNGHVFDPAENGTPGIPFRMLPQLFHGGPSGFEWVDHAEAAEGVQASSFWTRATLGRTLVRTDFNRDGKPDLVANSLDAPISILENRTDTSHWLRLDLVGTTSERDAIGAEVIATCGEQEFHGWMLAGGYMGANEPVVDVGLGEHDRVDRLDVSWPSGEVQTFRNVAVDTHYLTIENDERLHVR